MRREEIDTQVSELSALSEGYRGVVEEMKQRLKEELLSSVS